MTPKELVYQVLQQDTDADKLPIVVQMLTDDGAIRSSEIEDVVVTKEVRTCHLCKHSTTEEFVLLKVVR